METRLKILNIAMNLNRIGNWAADGYQAKQKRIKLFLNETSEYLKTLDKASLPTSLKDTFRHFLNEYKKLENEGLIGPKDPMAWAEQMMTWGNILTHRSRLIKD